MSKSGNQVKTGKAFEYALAKEYYSFLSSIGLAVQYVEDEKYYTAKSYYESCSDKEKELYDLSAKASIPTLIKLEPGLCTQRSEEDVLFIRLAGDSEGGAGDVRDPIYSTFLPSTHKSPKQNRHPPIALIIRYHPND